MTDMLVKLYEMPMDWSFLPEQAALGIEIRKPIGPEKHLIEDWVKEKFNDLWSSEVDRALSNTPVSCFIAVKAGRLIGFACYDATALGYFGPTGVEESQRGQGTGKALLTACLLDMRLKGYGYAVIGSVGPAEFYRKVVGAVEIPDSKPGIWKGMLVR
jgi:predicted GNAT family acetyltransferase